MIQWLFKVERIKYLNLSNDVVFFILSNNCDFSKDFIKENLHFRTLCKHGLRCYFEAQHLRTQMIHLHFHSS